MFKGAPLFRGPLEGAPFGAPFRRQGGPETPHTPMEAGSAVALGTPCPLSELAGEAALAAVKLVCDGLPAARNPPPERPSTLRLSCPPPERPSTLRLSCPNYYYERKGGGSVALFSARAPGGTDESACTCGFTCLGYSVIILIIVMFAQ